VPFEAGEDEGAEPAPTTALLIGVVRGADGQPLPGVVIRLRPLDGGAPLSTVTGADGAFQLGGLAAGSYEAFIEREGYAGAHTRIRLIAGKQRYDVGLQPQ
jgi:hypothetical protein